jgi:3-hydroxy acid dehydrogenase / malonic semialdehyde reductase
VLSSVPKSLVGRIAVITGASSGIGAATAGALARQGARVILGARRSDRLESVRQNIALSGGEAEAMSLDVSDPSSCESFVAEVLRRHGGIDILVNSAGLARGFEPVQDNDERDWREMIEANVMGLMRMTRAFLPALVVRGGGDIVHIGSIAGLEPYAKGAAYCASKAAVESFVRALRLELVGKRIRQLVIEPGMVETEFSVVRFHGDKARADAVYRGLTPLFAEDVAECIVFALTRPSHVCVQTLLVTPTAQASATVAARETPP